MQLEEQIKFVLLCLSLKLSMLGLKCCLVSFWYFLQIIFGIFSFHTTFFGCCPYTFSTVFYSHNNCFHYLWSNSDSSISLGVQKEWYLFVQTSHCLNILFCKLIKQCFTNTQLLSNNSNLLSKLVCQTSTVVITLLYNVGLYK